MAGFEPKKLALLRILQILHECSDEKHPLKQEDIANILDRNYGIVLERKAIGRNLFLLKGAGFEIESNREGSYLAQRQFEDSELRMLIDGVLSSRYITAKHSADLIQKLCSLSNQHFKSHVKNIYSVNDWSKTENPALFYHIELIDEAISNGNQLTFDYNKYGVDKKLHKSATHTVSPYQLLLHNQHYYLMALNERFQHVTYFRLDRITNMQAADAPATDLRSVKGFESGIDYKDLSTARPYMFSDRSVRVEFLTEDWMTDHVVDWFGYGVQMKKEADGLVGVSLQVSPNAMEFWAMQYSNYVEIISPESLREKIKENLITAIKKYK